MQNAQQPAAYAGRFAGKVALVTAAGGGIGGASALRFAREGAKAVVVMDVSPTVERMAGLIEGAGSQAICIKIDCTEERAVVSAFSDVLSRLGSIDVLVNGVGGGGGGRNTEFFESTPDTWRRIVDVTLLSTMLCTRQVVEGMRQRRYGKIVNIASSIALVPTVKMVEYASAKAGVLGFTRSSCNRAGSVRRERQCGIARPDQDRRDGRIASGRPGTQR